MRVAQRQGNREDEKAGAEDARTGDCYLWMCRFIPQLMWERTVGIIYD
jgi:hypothetical protein